jgi:NitT/TauT family transport system ATP-binding protein
MYGSGSVDAGTAVSLRGVDKTFTDGTGALSNVDLGVGHGEFVSVIGHSGCGKTTLLRIISGLDSATGGVVTRGTEDIAYVFQEPTLLPWRTVRANVELVAELKHVPRGQRRGRAAEAITQVGLAEFAGHRPAQLSGGMRMRAALAQGLMARPRLFLFDEPFGALDEMTRDRLCDQLQALYLAERFAAVFVTHSIAEAVYLSGRVLVMSPRPGRVVTEVAVPLDFPRRPEVRYTPGFAALAGRVAGYLRGQVPG